MRQGGQGRPAASQRRDPRPSAPPMPSAPPPVTRTITLAEGMTVKDLADKLELRVKDVLAKLLMKRLMLTINSTLDPETATMIAREFGAEVTLRSFEEELLQVDEDDARAEDVVTRAPVVTVMGHVDHGKTSLLDAIREARVAEREAGGITQHIGAYHVTINNRNIVFLDTPGHEAFTLMRARGAKVTDIVVLVVAADDGVMPQTREAIDHAKAAGVPIIVAINKIDKPNASPERVKRELTELDLMPEEWGGKTVTVEVSARQKTNIDLLLEMILLVSDIGELKANPKKNASGTVLEAKLDKGRGPVATILVQDGTLNVGDTFIAGPIVGRVRALIDDRGRPVKSAGPSMPVEVLGLTGLPQPGDAFQALADAAKARQIATFRQEQAKTRALGAKGGRLTLESLQAQIAEGGMKELPIIIKADVQGSAEVLADTLAKLTDEKVKIRIIHAGVGAVNESDVLLASASNAIIIAFNVRPDRNAEDIADARARRHPPALRHLQRHRRDEEGDDGAARADVQGSAIGHRRGPGHLQGPEVRHDRGLHGHRGAHHPLRRHPGTPPQRQRRRLRRQDRIAAPLQGRRERGEGRVRVRHRLRQVQRPQGRRRHRGVRDGASRGHGIATKTRRHEEWLFVPSCLRGCI